MAANLTPDAETGAARWSDDEIARAIREGIAHDGHAIFPMMPYLEYRALSDEDVASIVVSLRSVPPVRNPLPPTRLDFPVNYLIRNVPQPLTSPVSGPDPQAIGAQRGSYLVTIGCGCHTPADRKGPIPGLNYGGGERLPGAMGRHHQRKYHARCVRHRLLRRGHVHPDLAHRICQGEKAVSIMPFGQFANLTDDDLKAIFAYLRTVAPVKHRVDNSLPPTYCKLCRQKHGAGDQN